MLRMRGKMKYVIFHVKLFFYSVFENSIDFLFYNRIKFFTYQNNKFGGPYSIQKELDLVEKIIAYEIDKINKCVYYLTATGIHRKHFGGNKFRPDYSSELIVKSSEIRDLFLDVLNNYMYYQKTNSIILINLDTGIKKTIYASKVKIKKFVVFPLMKFKFFKKSNFHIRNGRGYS